jgi:hypothetical protein
MDQLDLSDFFTTKSQASDFSTRLAAIEENIYGTNFNLDNALLSQFGLIKKDKFLTLIRDQQINTSSASDLKSFLAKIQVSISALPVLSLTLAFEPKSETMKVFTDWFLLNLKKQVIFEIKVDRSIIAGALVTFNGKYLDLSIKSMFTEIVENQLQKKTPSPKTSETSTVLPVQSHDQKIVTSDK